MKKGLLSTLLLIALNLFVNAQSNQSNNAIFHEKTTIGVGAGLDFGGLGVNWQYYPNRKLGVFVGVGYPLQVFGVDIGMKYRFYKSNTSPKVIPFVTAMFGYNGYLNLSANFAKYYVEPDGSINYVSGHISNKVYSVGPSFGGGIDTKYTSKKIGYWSFGVLVPIRNSTFNDKLNYYKSLGATPSVPVLPFLFSVGYRFVIK